LNIFLWFSGGLDLKTQEAALRSGPDVVVATPGRLIDHLHNSPNFSLNTIEVLVLDEADRMLEEAFKDQMNELIRLCAPNRQTLLFSATMTDQIDELAAMSLKKPVKIFINENTETALKLRQEFVRIRAGREGDREAIVSALVTRTFQSCFFVFSGKYYRVCEDEERLSAHAHLARTFRTKGKISDTSVLILCNGSFQHRR
ncbi:DEAD/DEAH box helicase, partial [Oesophagostomum dentatum]